MASNLTLYWIPLSPPSWRVHLCLEEKKLLGYTSKQLSYEKREHKSEEVLKINPRGEVPSFRDGDIFVNESLAACLYLEDKFKSSGSQLLPSDDAGKALALQRMQEADNVYKNVMEGYMLYHWMKKPELEDKEFMQKQADKARAEIARWDKYLEDLGPGSYLAGKTFTLADISFAPGLTFLVCLGLNMSKYPHLKAYYELVTQRPSFKATKEPYIAVMSQFDHLKDL